MAIGVEDEGPEEGKEILPKIRELFHYNLTLCAECFIRNYVSSTKTFTPKLLNVFSIHYSFCQSVKQTNYTEVQILLICCNS